MGLFHGIKTNQAINDQEVFYMSEEIKRLFNQRLGRYQAAIAMEPTDRVPTAFQTLYFAIKNSGYNYQQIMYDPEIWLKVKLDFSRKYPEVDIFRINLLWAPSFDVTDYRIFKVPGRDISEKSLQQFDETEYMKADEYRMFIDDPVGFRMERYFPRVFGEYEGKGSVRSHMAFLKSGMAQGINNAINRERAARLASEVGLPVPVMGNFVAPFDYLSDRFRGLNGIIRDMFRQPDNVKEACEAILPDLLNITLAGADPLKRYPIFVATHKPCFLSPKQFDDFYWPTFKKGMMMLIEAGYTFRVFLEGNWEAHWHHIAEFPKGTVLCDIDNGADIFKAKEAFGHKQCIAGGMPDQTLIFGSPEQVRARVKLLCETVGKDGGLIIRGGTNVPEDTKPENFRALLDAIMEYGKYSDGPAPEPKSMPKPSGNVEFPQARMVTPWEVKKADWKLPGDEELIRRPWEMLEKMAYNWLIAR